jgi:hypothetical protein
MRAGVLAVVLAGLSLRAAAAHPVPRTTVREMIRVQGTRAPESGAPGPRVTLAALGSAHPFAVGTWQVVVSPAADAAAPPAAPEQKSFTLEGDRAVLARFAGARPGQAVTLLVERRPGASTLFVLALDLCPPR